MTLLDAAPRLLRKRGDDGLPHQRVPRPAPAEKPTTRREAPESLSVASSALSMVALLCLWFVVQTLFLSGLSEARSQHLLYQDFREQVAAATAPVGPVVPAGDPVAVLVVPVLGLHAVVVEGTASGDLQAGPGHRRDTVLPGQAGVSLVYGRASTYGAPFGHLARLTTGDPIYTQTAQGRQTFTVTGVRRAGDPVPPPLTGTQARLTLVSTEGTGLAGRLGAATTVYVDAVAPKGYAFPAGRPVALPASERAMAGEPAALPLLSLALALLLGLALAVAWARRRWSAPLIWVIASPVALALAWSTTDTVVRLLPNLL
jgi:sortase A